MKLIGKLFSTLVGLGCLLSAQATPIPAPQFDLPKMQVRMGGKQAQVQVARSDEERAIGLMGRVHLEPNEGMLFIFPSLDVQCFWMRNTLLPLSAAFINDAGRVVNFADMQPLSDQAHCSAQPVRYVLEMPQGWFEQAGLRVGSPIKGEWLRP